jgi:hypothetical protein
MADFTTNRHHVCNVSVLKTWSTLNPSFVQSYLKINEGDTDESLNFPPRVDHLDVVGRLPPTKNGNQEFTKRPDLNTPT